MSRSKSQEVWLECPGCGVELRRIRAHHFDHPGLTRTCPHCGALTHLCVETRGDERVAYLVTDEELQQAGACRGPSPAIIRQAWELMQGEVRDTFDAFIVRGREAEILIAALASYDLSKALQAALDRHEYERGLADLIADRKRLLEH